MTLSKTSLKVLVLCEYSGVVRDAFTARGHDATSCDILPTEAPGQHHTGDAFDMLGEPWDIIIAHPPCTHLSVSGNRHYGKGKPRHYLRVASAEWTQRLWNCCIARSHRVCFENPVGVLRHFTNLPQPNYVQPWQFGHAEQKKTGLFLHGLPPLVETDNVYDEMMELPRSARERIWYMSPSADRGKLRSATYPGIAAAMAAQWGV